MINITKKLGMEGERQGETAGNFRGGRKKAKMRRVGEEGDKMGEKDGERKFGAKEKLLCSLMA